MPIAKKRPHIIELLNIAVAQKKIVIESRQQILSRPFSIWIKESTYAQKQEGFGAETTSSIVEDEVTVTNNWRHKLKKLGFYYFVWFSHFAENLMLNKYYLASRIIAFVFGAAVLIREVPLLNDDVKPPASTAAIDNISNILFLLDAILRVGGLYIRWNVEKAFNREIPLLSLVLRSGCVDIVMTLLSFIYGLGYLGLWFRIFRLIVLFSILTDVFPHLDVLLSGITSGIKSTFFTIVLFISTNIFYASIGHILFASNDPFHFGSYGMSFLSFVQLATFDNWSMIYYLNYGGCDSIPSEYDFSLENMTKSEITFSTRFGNFQLPQCSEPRGRPVLATLVFGTFVIFEGYVIVSMCLAAVAIGINDKLESLRHTEVYGDNEMDEGLSDPNQQEISIFKGQNVGESPNITPRRNMSHSESVMKDGLGTGNNSNKSFASMAKDVDKLSKFETENDADCVKSIHNEKFGHSSIVSKEYSEGAPSDKSLARADSSGGTFHTAAAASSTAVVSAASAAASSTHAPSSPNHLDTQRTAAQPTPKMPNQPKFVPNSPTRRNSLTNRMSKAAKLLGSSDEAQEIKLLLKQIWKTNGQQNNTAGAYSQINDSPGLMYHIHHLAVILNVKLASSYYKVGYALCIVGDVAALLYAIDLTEPLSVQAMIDVAWIFQVLFLLDTITRLYCRLAGSYHTDDCLKDGWFWFSLVLSICNIIALSTPNAKLDWVAFLLMLRLLRILRLFKTISLYYVDMKIILTSFSSAFVSLLYVILLVFFYFSYFAIAGILLLKRSVPFHFADLSASYRTLYNVMTYDNWGDVMKQAMFGCKNYGYSTGLPKFDNTCDWVNNNSIGEGVGYFASIFFLVFIIITGMVLTSLLVGVIIKSLELLKEENAEEKEIRDKLNKVKKKYHLDNDTVTVYLKLFEVIDKNANGRLVFPELSVMLSALEMDSSEQFQFFIKVDSDKSGQIDFSEFAEMMALISLAKRTHSAMHAKPTPFKNKRKQETVKRDLEALSRRVLVTKADILQDLEDESNNKGKDGSGTAGSTNPRSNNDMLVPRRFVKQGSIDGDPTNPAIREEMDDHFEMKANDTPVAAAAAFIKSQLSSRIIRKPDLDTSTSIRGSSAFSSKSRGTNRIVPVLEPIDKSIPAPRHAF